MGPKILEFSSWGANIEYAKSPKPKPNKFLTYKVKTEYELKNGGKEDVSSFVHIMLADEAARLSWMSAFETGKEASKYRISRVLPFYSKFSKK